MNNDQPTPQRITPENPPKAPFWAWNTHVNEWSPFDQSRVDAWLALGLEVFAQNGFTHWLPDQLEAPTVRPEELSERNKSHD